MISSFDRMDFFVTFPTVPVPVAEVWQILSTYLKECKSLPAQFNFAQPHTADWLRLSADEIRNLIQTENHDGFLVDSGKLPRGVTFKLYHAKNLGRQSVFHSVIASQAKAPNEWRPMLEKLMTSFPVTGAWQLRGRYRAWQRANCIEKCYEELYGTLPPGFKLWKEPSIDGHGPVLTLIDISLPHTTREIGANPSN